MLVWLQAWLDKLNLRSEVSGEVNSTTDLGQLGEWDTTKSRVVGNLESTTNSLEVRDGDVGEGWVSNESQSTLSVCSVTDGCQVWCVETGEVVLVESEGSVDDGQRWNANTWDVTEGHVGSPDKVREADIQALSVGINVEESGNIANLGAEGLEAVVVVDVQGVDGVQVNTIKCAQEGVGNGNTLCAANGVGKGEGWESWKSGPVDGSNLSEGGELKSGQESQVVQGESTIDAAKSIARETCNGSVVLDDQVTTDLFRSTKADDTRGSGADNNVTLDGFAISQSGSISSGVDGSCWLRTDGIGSSWRKSSQYLYG